MSNLPDEIISHIGSLLNVRDAARMNTIASKYRFVSSSLRKLDFCRSIVCETEECKNCEPACCRRHKLSFVRSVNQFLDSYFGTIIHRFSICFCLKREFKNDLERWITFAVKLGVGYLELKFSCPKHIDRYKRIPNAAYRHSMYLEFPSHLLPQGVESKLNHLNLQTCIFRLNPRYRFNSINSLSLCDVLLSAVDMIGILTSCLNLEHLKLTYCILTSQFFVCGSELRLKTFKVLFCFRVSELHISAPDLIAFEYAGYNLKFSFIDVPKLESVHYKASCNKGLGYVFSQFGKDIPHLKCLFINIEKYDWVTSMPCCLTELGSLKRLDLFLNIHIPNIAKYVVAILKACPVLQTVNIMEMSMSCCLTKLGTLKRLELFLNTHIPNIAKKPVANLKASPILQTFNNMTVCWREQDTNPNVELRTCVDDHLLELVFAGFAATKHQVALAKYLVENAGTLKRLVLDVRPVIYEGNSAWTRGRHNKFPDDNCDRLIKILYKKAASKNLVITMIGEP